MWRITRAHIEKRGFMLSDCGAGSLPHDGFGLFMLFDFLSPRSLMIDCRPAGVVLSGLDGRGRSLFF